MLPDLALLSTLIGSNYPCLKLIYLVPKVFEPLKFDCNTMENLKWTDSHTVIPEYIVHNLSPFFLYRMLNLTQHLEWAQMGIKRGQLQMHHLLEGPRKGSPKKTEKIKEERRQQVRHHLSFCTKTSLELFGSNMKLSPHKYSPRTNLGPVIGPCFFPNRDRNSQIL